MLIGAGTDVFAQKTDKEEKKEKAKKEGKNDKAPKEPIVIITTEYGDIKMKLFNETPLHRDNFLKLARSAYFDTSIFHRVIKNFMIQGGGGRTGMSDPGYTVPAEIVPGLYHKRGMLCAARTGDEVNPLRASSGSQFYIVHGQVFKPEELKGFEDQTNGRAKQMIFQSMMEKPENAAMRNKFITFQQRGMQDSLQALIRIIEPIIEAEFAKKPAFKFSEQQIKDYTTTGGAPHLDGQYTIFGEVLEGMDVVDKIAAVEVGEAAKPLKDIYMKIKVVE